MVDDEFGRIKVFYSDDDKLKILGELLGNKSSRDIIRLLIYKESYTNDIARRLNLRANLVIHHLKKMESIGLVEVRTGRITKKGKEHRFFRVHPGILVLPEGTESEGALKKLFKRTVKFAAVGASAALSYFLVDMLQVTQVGGHITSQIRSVDPLVYPLVVVIAGLAVLYLKKKTR